MICCTKCKTAKPSEEFHKEPRKLNGRSSHCKKCASMGALRTYHKYREALCEQKRQKRNADPEAARLYEKAWNRLNPDYCKGKRLKQYWPGATWKEALQKYRELLVQFNGVCGICRQPERTKSTHPPFLPRDLAVDHCHRTGQVRGLLCDACNVLIARAQDSPDICISAADYLRRVS